MIKMLYYGGEIWASMMLSITIWKAPGWQMEGIFDEAGWKVQSVVLGEYVEFIRWKFT